MSQFSEYPSITNHYQSRFISAFESLLPPDEQCHFTEKVHGANLQIYITENEVRPARRTALLKDGESFNGAWGIVEAHRAKFVALYEKALDCHYPEAQTVIVCGEVCGGDYPGVKADKPAARVQQGVYYSPNHVFYAFDVCVQYPDGTVDFLDWDKAVILLDEVGIFRAQTLHTMTVREVVNELREHNTIRHIPSTFESTIAKRLGLPYLESNTAEGYVIKPNKTYFDGNGTPGSRLIIKYKSDKFEEKKSGVKEKPVADSSFELMWSCVKDEFIVADAMRNRLHCLLSKGEFRLDEPKQRGALLKSFATDVMNDVKSTHGELLGKYSSDVQKRVFTECGKFLQSEATRAI